MNVDNLQIVRGHLTRDPEYYKPDGEKKQRARFTIAVNRISDDRADFFPCVAFGKLADTIDTYLHKGSQVLAVGSWHNDPYEKDGIKRDSWRLICDGVRFLDKKTDSSKAEAKQSEFEGFEVVAEDVPF